MKDGASQSVLELTSIPAKNKSLDFVGDHVLLGWVLYFARISHLNC